MHVSSHRSSPSVGSFVCLFDPTIESAHSERATSVTGLVSPSSSSSSATNAHTMALQAKKRKEAEELVHQADKCLAKTMLRWAPDYMAAAPLLEKAADAFRAAGDYGAAKRTFAQAAAAQLKNKSLYRAAQNHENIAKVALQQLRETRATGADKRTVLNEIAAAFDAASGYYSDMGEMGKAADALLKAATTCEEQGLDDITQLAAFYDRACALMEAQDKPHFAVEPFRKTLAFLVKHGLYADALRTQPRLVAVFQQIDQPANVHKLYLSELVLLLATGDAAAADQAYMRQLQEDAFLASDECALADDLVRAFKTGSEELLQVTIRKQGFSFLDNQVARLSRKLTIYGGGGGATSGSRPTPPAARAAPASTATSRTQNHEPQQPRVAPSSNPFAPAPTPAPVPAPTPAPTSVHVVPAPVPVLVPATLSAPEPAPSQAPDDDTLESEEIGEFNFDDTTARATVAFGQNNAEQSLSFDFESLEFSMPSEADTYDTTEPEASSLYASASAAVPAPLPPRQQAAPAAAPPADDDMFDLT